MTTRVYLVRHGATELNRLVPYRLQGRRSDPPLDALGRAQARRVAEVLAGLPLAAAYGSPLRRSLETARIIAEPHGLPAAAVPELIEAEIGRWEGKTWDEVARDDPAEHARFMADPGTVPYPEGESFLDVQRRVAPAVAALARAHAGGHIVVVGHNVVNRAYLALLLGVPIARARALRQSNGGINVIVYEGDEPRLETLNAAFHLEGLDPHAPPRGAAGEPPDQPGASRATPAPGDPSDSIT